MLANGYLIAATSRLYYACFYAVSALLLSEGMGSSKHTGVKALFNREWIKTGRLPAEMGDLYRDLFDSRQLGDYVDLTSFQQEAVETWLTEAKAFVERIAQEIAKSTC